MDQALQQPDFPLAVRSLETLTEQVARCQNLPAVDGGLRLAEALDAMRNDLRDMRNEIRTVNRKLDDLDRKVDGLDRKVTAERRNAVARAQNAVVVRSNMELEPLCSVITGERLERFPGTLAYWSSWASQWKVDWKRNGDN
ncbi:hypothetical protein HRG_002122 [Hirsutella rhossiliensis]|uniref:Uncharacterized protein n=1 Tax=Hirsutella rhossiliensis TaxID=111463 RepID=A0A9P8N1W7_9HYPO|nr:uncharacterized protein HRG_02122 [Hirsutella rhossiliensis]KAH0966713.1 hypothetical protein HRG_02122 [Hirsutella rhossiliensis]